MLQYVSWMKGMCVGGDNRMETIPRNRWTCYEDKTNGAGDIALMFKTLGLDPECHVCAHTKDTGTKTWAENYKSHIVCQ